MVQMNLEQARELVASVWVAGGVVDPRRTAGVVGYYLGSLREGLQSAARQLVETGAAEERNGYLFVGDLEGLTLRDFVEPVRSKGGRIKTDATSPATESICCTV